MLTGQDIAHQRLFNQHIAAASFETPLDVVAWMGAVQAQDYAAAKWALGLRSKGVSDTDIDQAFANGTILRTHVMRPTWHFVAPIDIRWMLTLTAPRINALAAYYYRKLELDDAIFAHSDAVLARALQSGKQLTRNELGLTLQQNGINTGDLLRLAYVVGHAELAGIVCSGGRRGKQFTYALLDERAPQTKTMERDEALAELARRYFASHGPATLKDYVWWSGLAATDAQAGLEMVKTQLSHEVIEDQTYWFAASTKIERGNVSAAYLLPNYDEYIVGYTDRKAVFDGSHTQQLDSRGNILFQHTIVINGKVVGTWKRTFKKGMAAVELKPFDALTVAESHAVEAAAQRFAEFLGMPVELSSI